MSDSMLKTYTDFSRGENVDTAIDNLLDNELMKAENIDLNQRGGFSYRKGCVKFNATSYGAQVEQLEEWQRADGSVQLVGVIGTDFCTISEVGGEKTVIQALNPAVKKCFCFPFQDKLYFGDGHNYYVYDGTTSAEVTPAEVDKSETTPDLTAIKRCKYAALHPPSYCFFFAGDSQNKNALYYSESNEPNNVKQTSVLFPTHAMGEITGLKVFGDSVVVFYKYGARIARGIDPKVDMVWEEIPLPNGTMSNDAIVLTPSSLTFPGNGGLYSIPPSILGYNVTLQLGQDVVPNIAANRQTKTINSITNPSITCAVFDPVDSELLLAYSDGFGATRNSKVLVYFWDVGGFTRYTGWQVNDWCLRANGDLLFASNNFIYKARTGLSDAGNPIAYKAHTKKYNLDAPDYTKHCAKVFINAAQQGNQSHANVIIYTENNSSRFSDIDLNERTKWQGIWKGKWGQTELNRRELKLVPKLKGSRIQIRYEMTASDMEAVFYGHTIQFKLKKPKGKRVLQDGTS